MTTRMSSPINGKPKAHIGRRLHDAYQCDGDLQEESVTDSEVEICREVPGTPPDKADFFWKHQNVVVIIQT